MISIFRAALRTEPVTALYEALHHCALTPNQIRERESSRIPLLSACPAAIMLRGCIVVAADCYRAVQILSTEHAFPLPEPERFFNGCLSPAVSSRRLVVGSH
jgi:hypothetical protein